MPRGSRAGAIAAALCALAVAGGVASAVEVRVFRAQSAAAFLAGEVDGVSVDEGGALGLARRVEKAATIEEPFALALARWGDGWVIGTGNEGRVVAVDRRGGSRVLFDSEESEIFALWADADGTLFAGSSPDGKVYRLRDGGSEVWFDPEETYIWAIVRDRGGALWVATGAPGRLYRVTGEGEAERVWDGGAEHLRSLLPTADGGLLVGTAGDARVMRWRDGVLRTLYDSDLNEVVALASAPDGGVWAAILSSEASFVDLTPKPAAGSEDPSQAGAVVVVDDGQAAAGSRPPGSRAPRSKLVRIGPGGSAEELWSSADETIFDLAADGERLWAGTGLSGRLYRFEGGRVRVEKELEEKQIVAVRSVAGAADGELTLLTTNGAGLWRLTEQREATGSYTSGVFDAQQPARFGVFRWEGELPRGTGVAVAARSGFSSEPDSTWTEWSAPASAAEVNLAGLEVGRFVQFRLDLAGREGVSPRVTSTELTYRQENVRPAIASLTVLDPGQILVPSGFNPAEQLFEPASPNREGIFDTLRPAARDDRLKPVWKRGWRTLRWEASDPNGDALRYRLEVRPEARPDAWIELADDVEATFFAFDAAALPDGLYRFRLTATDARDNRAPGEARETARESEVVELDQTPPVLVAARRVAGGARVEVYDAGSALREAELSIDGSEWRPVAADDGLLDGRREELVVESIPDGARTVLLRLTDTSFNVRSFDLLAALEKKR